MTNTAVHIVLPKGLKLRNGAQLHADVTCTLISRLDPFYCSPEQVVLAGGPYLKKLPELSVACQVYMSSKMAESHTYRSPVIPAEGTPETSPVVRQYRLFLNARQTWTMTHAAHELLSNIWDMAGARGSKTLANFSVERLSATRDDGVPQRLAELSAELDKWRIVLNSGGDVGYAGRVKGAWGQKGLYGDPDKSPGRTWVTTGMGANSVSAAGSGSWGKPVRYSNNPLFVWRTGRIYTSYLLSYFTNRLQ